MSFEGTSVLTLGALACVLLVISGGSKLGFEMPVGLSSSTEMAFLPLLPLFIGLNAFPFIRFNMA